MKPFWICFVLALAGEALACQFALRPYSDTTASLLMTGWAVGSVLLAWFARRPFVAYFGSVALAAPGISYGMLHPCGLEFGGILHVLSAGAYAMPFYWLFGWLRKRRSRPGQ